MQAGAPIAAQADDPCSTPNVAPTFLPRDSRSTPQPTRTPLPYDPCAPSQTPTQTPSPSPSALPALPQSGLTGIVSIYRPSDQTFYLRYTQTGQYHERSIHLDYALSGDIPVVGDWNGDGYTNVGVYRPSTAQFLLTTSEAAVICAPDHTITYGNLDALPLAGKWTAGATADSIGVWHGGVFSFRQSLTDASTTDKAYGDAADTPLVGNWAGDGVDRPAVWRNGQGMFYLDNNDVTQTVLFGNPNDTPLAGDWDGNGVDGVGVRREGMLYLTNTLSGVGELYQTAFYGLPSDVPVVGVWRALSADQLPPPLVCAVPQCPWGGTYLPSTDECQYTFNAQQRKAAAEWAISWAGGACILFCTFNFEPAATSVYFPTQIPTPTTHRCATGYNTDCANFVSQALFYGGLPMNHSWFCNFWEIVNGNQVLLEVCNRGRQGNYPQGWGLASRAGNPYGLPGYVAERDAWELGIVGLGGTDTFRNSEIQNALQFTPNQSAAFPNVFYEWDTELIPKPMPAKVGELMNFLADNNFVAGDLMYTTDTGRNHVFIIIGWGPYVETWEQLRNVYPEQISQSRTNENHVVYVVDHGPHGEYVIENPSIPALNKHLFNGFKPYYASRWRTENTVANSSWVDGPRQFVKVPNTFTLPFANIQADSAQQMLSVHMPIVCPIITPMP